MTKIKWFLRVKFWSKNEVFIHCLDIKVKLHVGMLSSTCVFADKYSVVQLLGAPLGLINKNKCSDSSLVVQWLTICLSVMAGDTGSTPGRSLRSNMACGPKKKNPKNQHCNKLSKDFKNDSHQKEKKMFLKGTHIEARMVIWPTNLRVYEDHLRVFHLCKVAPCCCWSNIYGKTLAH